MGGMNETEGDHQWPQNTGSLRPGRRQFVGGFLAASLLAFGPKTAQAARADGFSTETTKAINGARSAMYFTRWGAGAHDGRSWQNAMPIERLSKSQALVMPGNALLIGVDPAKPFVYELGRKKPQVFVRKSGSNDAPIIIAAGATAGVEGLNLPSVAGDDMQFRSVAPWSVKTFGKTKGPPFFIGIENDASHILLAGFRMEGTSADGFFKFRSGKIRSADFDDITFSDVDAVSVGRVIEADEGSRLTNITVRNCRAFGIIRGFARFHNLSQSTLRDLDLDANHLDAGAKNVCQLIAVEKGADILFENILLKNAISTKTLPDGSPGYTQGDGIVCEKGTKRVRIRNCHGSSMGDAAFDLKTVDVTVEDSSSEDCKFGARVWSAGKNLIRNCTFIRPVTRAATEGCCIQVSGQCDVVDTKLQAGDGTFALGLNRLKRGEPPIVRLHGGSIQLDGEAGLARTNATGTVELHDVAVNGELRTETYHLDNNTAR
jgi:hypothetical protein